MKLVNILRMNGALFGVLIFFNAVVGLLYLHSVGQTQGTYIYPLDDTYIHLTVAKNVALNGYWGVTENVFCSTSSSPIYTLVLSGMIALFGNSTVYPLLLNIVFGNLLLISLFGMCKQNTRMWLFLAVCMFSPVLLHVQVLSGMEHVLHALLLVWFIILLRKVFYHQSAYNMLGYSMVCGVLCLTRYESMFIVFAVSSALAFFVKHRGLAVITILASTVPVVAFGLFSILNGGYFFPNSVLAKGNVQASAGLLGHLYSYMYGIGKVLVVWPTLSIPAMVIAICVFALYRARSINFSQVQQLAIGLAISAVATLILHAALARLGWLYRYEAYLYVLLFVGIVTLMQSGLQLVYKRVVYGIVAVYLVCAGVRCADAQTTIYWGSKNIYEQQMQMAGFISKYYNTSSVALHDIGAVGYFANTKLIDLEGLGSTDILQLRKTSGGSFKARMEELLLAKQPDVIVVNEGYLGLTQNPEFIRIGSWEIQNNIICASSKVVFLATTEEQANVLQKNLAEFEKTLPPDVLSEQK